MMNLIKKQKGFTLIELMIVVAIIGILAAIAIPQFASYRVKAFNSAAQSDMHTLQTVFEVFFNDNSKYPNTHAVATGTVTLTDGTNSVSLNTSNLVSMKNTTPANGQSYTASTKHLAGDTIYNTDSASPTLTTTSSAAGTVLP